MKYFTLILLISTITSWGSGTRWINVSLPTHVLFVDEGDSGGVTEVPCVTSSSSSFERIVSVMNLPYIPHHGNWNQPKDTNLVTLYKISISGRIHGESEKRMLEITIDCRKAVRPEGYPFTIDEVIGQVKKCVKSNLNPYSIKTLLR